MAALVERMTGSPPNCLGCGRGNTPDGDTGEIGPFVDLQRQVDWNDDVYLCVPCVTGLGALVGMITADDQKDYERRIENLKGKLHDLRADNDLRKQREREALRKARAAA